jgi:hypothetical protein
MRKQRNLVVTWPRAPIKKPWQTSAVIATNKLATIQKVRFEEETTREIAYLAIRKIPPMAGFLYIYCGSFMRRSRSCISCSHSLREARSRFCLAGIIRNVPLARNSFNISSRFSPR